MKMQLKQQTVGKSYSFEGKGLHTGKVSRITVNPAPVDYGIRFRRTDIGEDAIIDAVAGNVSSTARSTTISKDDISVMTIEHLMSALTGMGVDNALVDIDNVEVPILDGSAKPYIDAMWQDGKGIVEQDAPRKYLELASSVEIKNEETGAYVRIEPADVPSFDLTIDFNSKVLGVQSAHWDPSVTYAEEIGICRTFVFFHEIEYLFKNNLIKGGDVENAIVLAINAGADMLVMGNNISTGYEPERPFRIVDMIVRAVKDGRIGQQRLVESNRRIDRLMEKLESYGY